MKLTLLDGDAGMALLKQHPDTFPSIFLTRNFHPVQVSPIGLADQHTICSTEERCIHDQIHWLLFYNNFAGCSCMSIEVFAKCFRIFFISCPEIIVRLPSLCVILVSISYPYRFLFVLTNEDMFAHLAFVRLPTRLSTIFLDQKRTAGDALFLNLPAQKVEKETSVAGGKDAYA